MSHIKRFQNSKIPKLFSIIAILLTLFACGQQGPLYIPDQSEPIKKSYGKP